MAFQEDIDDRQKKPSARTPTVRRGKVVFNYGDVGLTEAKHFDILSRFLIVMLEPDFRVIPTRDNMASLFVLVKRPYELWISVDGGVQSSSSNQMRSDAMGNVNKGDPAAYSINNIPGINRPYYLGEEIVVKTLDYPMSFSNGFFTSAFPSSDFTAANSKYVSSYLTRDPSGPQSVSGNAANWEVSRLYPLFPAGGNTRVAAINGQIYTGASIAGFLNASTAIKTQANQGNPVVAPTIAYNVNYQYGIGINKYQFEIFWRYLATDLNIVNSVIGGNFTVANYKDAYFWANPVGTASSSLIWNSCHYEDINADNKARIPTSECLPLIVTQPNTFPIPRTRQAGSIKFDPTFSQIIN